MLRVVQNRSAVGAKSYFSQSDYYMEGQELAGTWGGKTSELLGLRGTIEQSDFDALCDNLDPRTRQPLTVRTKTDRTIGYDFNFHVPKGVSLAYSLRQDERILTAFRQSVAETMADIEEDAKTRVRMGGRQEDRTTGNLVWGEFVHKTARPVNGLPDPHLHAHCFVFNTTFDSREKRFKAAQFRDLKRHAPYYEALFYARLAKRLSNLGYGIERHGRQWDLADVPQRLRSKFSRRTALIEKEAAERGLKDVEQKAELGSLTREAKAKELSYPELQDAWRAMLDDAEQEWLTQTLPMGSAASVEHERRQAKLAMQGAISHCFERNAVVGERALLTEALRRGVGDVVVDDVKQEQHAQHVISREINGQRLVTTSDVVQEERAVLDYARQGRNQCSPLNDNWRFERHWLSDEQKQAVQQLVRSRDKVQILRGYAGTGKTSLMQEAVAAIEANGHSVLTFAPSAAASKGVLRDEGFASATTVSELLVNAELQAQAKGKVLWIDEAGLLGTRQLKQVTDLADHLQSRLILAGDWRQHGSVERGGLLKLLEDRAGLKPAEIGSIRRQSGEYRAAVMELAAGHVAEGFDRLTKLGWVQELSDEHRDAQIATDYAKIIKKGDSALVVSPTHREASHLTAAIREELRKRDRLGADTQTITRLVPVHYTESERRDAAFYQPGDIIIFHQNAPGHRKGERMTVERTAEANLLAHAARFSVYRQEDFTIAPGERIRATSNITTLDGKHRLHNGTCYTVTGFTDLGDLCLSNGWTVSRNAGHLHYGYVATSHSSQGRTVDHVLIAESAESFAAAGKEQFYVSVSRGRSRATVYTDDILELRSAVQQSQAKLTASEFLRQSHISQLMRKRHATWHQRAAATMPKSINKQFEVEYGSRTQ